jgi:Helix-turn-helix.
MEEKSQKRTEAIEAYMMDNKITTLEDLAVVIDISYATLVKFRQGNSVSRKTIFKIADVIGVSPGELY